MRRGFPINSKEWTSPSQGPIRGSHTPICLRPTVLLPKVPRTIISHVSPVTLGAYRRLPCVSHSHCLASFPLIFKILDFQAPLSCPPLPLYRSWCLLSSPPLSSLSRPSCLFCAAIPLACKSYPRYRHPNFLSFPSLRSTTVLVRLQAHSANLVLFSAQCFVSKRHACVTAG